MVSETEPVSVVTDTVIPEGLCGMNGCVLTPHDRFTPHSWDSKGRSA